MIASFRSRLPALALLVALAPAAAAQYSGSVYTTNSKAVVDNVFSKPRDVYMAGGPGPNAGCSGNGLPDGAYYFQVTDPSGSTLLSTDPLADRAVVVSGGVITASGSHSTRNGPCGSRIVQLDPFAPTPNSSGEYKVWLIPAADYVPGGPNHGFPSSASKTDNFKVRSGKPVEQALIEGYVFYDITESGQYDPGEPDEVPLSGWRIEIVSDGELDVIFTDVDGHYEFIRDAGTSHVLTSVAPAPGYVGTVGGRWWGTNPTVATVIANVPETTTNFGLLYFINSPELALSKGYWHNQGEATLAANDPEWREVVNGLCLRQNFTVSGGYPEEETRFYVTETGSFSEAFQQLSDYLVGNPNLGVMAYTLSVQFCAGVLNKNFGNLQVTTFLDEFDDDILVEFSSIVTTSRDLLCDPRSGDTGPFGDPEWRDILEKHLSVNEAADRCRALLPEWSGMNSDGQNIYTRDGAPPDFLSPYN